MDKLLSESSAAGTDESSHIGELIEDCKGPLPTDPDRTATTSEIAREEVGSYVGDVRGSPLTRAYVPGITYDGYLSVK